jgi:predicted 2-oxoglutarate/Fe(II)-dependent dioxygenase YbiX
MENYETIKYKYNENEIIEFKNKNIYIIENLFDLSLCSQIIYEMDNSLTYKYLSYFDGNNVQCYNITDAHNISIKTKLIDIITELINFIKITFPYINIESFSFFELRKVYGNTREHVDGIFGETIEHPLHNNCLLKTTRVLTIVVSLNDDYDGGVYSFPQQNLKIKLKTGSCILFPPYWTHPHSVSDVNNNRYIFSLWGLTDNVVINNNNSQLNNIIILN